LWCNENKDEVIKPHFSEEEETSPDVYAVLHCVTEHEVLCCSDISHFSFNAFDQENFKTRLYNFGQILT
jgi:hypothetical protein